MDKFRAFEVLVQATGQLTANRETHVAIQQAIDVIKKLIEEKPEKKVDNANKTVV